MKIGEHTVSVGGRTIPNLRGGFEQQTFEYQCRDCKLDFSISRPFTREATDEQVAQTRWYAYGYFLSRECEHE